MKERGERETKTVGETEKDREIQDLGDRRGDSDIVERGGQREKGGERET